jgi:hypothetical protein
LSERETLQGGKVLSVAKVKTTHRTILVGSASAQVAAGQTQRVVIALNGVGASLLAKYKTLRPTLTVVQGSVSLARDTVTFVKHAHGKHKKH